MKTRSSRPRMFKRMVGLLDRDRMMNQKLGARGPMKNRNEESDGENSRVKPCRFRPESAGTMMGRA